MQFSAQKSCSYFAIASFNDPWKFPNWQNRPRCLFSKLEHRVSHYFPLTFCQMHSSHPCFRSALPESCCLFGDFRQKIWSSWRASGAGQGFSRSPRGPWGCPGWSHWHRWHQLQFSARPSAGQSDEGESFPRLGLCRQPWGNQSRSGARVQFPPGWRWRSKVKIQVSFLWDTDTRWV